MSERFYLRVWAALFLALFIAAAARATAVSENDGGLILSTRQGEITVSFLEKGTVRVELKAQNIDSQMDTYMTDPGALKRVPFTLDAERGVAASDEVTLHFSAEPLSLIFTDRLGQELIALDDDGIKTEPDRAYSIKFRKEDHDRYFGLGEPWPGNMWTDLYGRRVRLDNQGRRRTVWNRHVPPSYLTFPFFLSPRGYGLLIENPYRAVFDFSGLKTIAYQAEGGPLRFYVFTGRSMYDVLDAYSQLTGRAPIPPRWVTGYFQSKCGYAGPEDFEWLMDNFRNRHIPCDALIFDLDWYAHAPGLENTPMGDLTWSPEYFPDPAAFQKQMEERGFKTIVIIQPYVVMSSKNWESALPLAAKDRAGNPRIVNVWHGSYPQSLLLDYNNPATQRWYAQQVFDLHSTGIDAWWTDLNEPETDRADMVFYQGAPDHAVHNIQELLQHRAIYDMYRERIPEERAFFISRGGFVGDWRYGAGIWSGDVNSSWNHLRKQVPIGLSASLSGYGLWNSDVGGFHRTPTPELYTRWVQFGAFCPIFRAHGGGTPREPWSFGEAAEAYTRKIIELRYRLSPYLYTLYREMHDLGRPVMRAMFLEFPDDEKSFKVQRQYMYGPWLLVAPIGDRGVSSIPVYLPAGTWTDYWTEETVEGPATIRAKTPLDRIPLFVRSGAIIPMAPLMQYTGERPVDPLTVHIYPDNKPSQYKIYDDDGRSYRYEKGEFSFLPVKVTPGERTEVQVGPREGSFASVPGQSYVIAIHHLKNFRGVKLDATELGAVDKINEDLLMDRAGYNYDKDKSILRVFVPARAEFRIVVE